MARHWNGTPRWWRALGAYVLIDPTLAVGVDGYERHSDPQRAHAHYLGGAVALWIAWVTAIAVGATAGAAVPASWRLDFVIPLFLVGEVVTKVRDSATRDAVVAAAVVAVVALHAPLHLGPMLAIGAGVVVGMRAMERVR
jgi:predicted branched-subunit amino acid permease